MRIDVAAPLKGRRLIVACCGSIAAVKVPLLVSALVQAGAEVRCVVTPSAARLVSPVALASLSRHVCYQDGDEWSPSCPRPLHIELAEWAELVIIAPLSATSLGRWCAGMADGLLASLLLATGSPCARISGDEHRHVGPPCGSSELGHRAHLAKGPWSVPRLWAAGL